MGTGMGACAVFEREWIEDAAPKSSSLVMQSTNLPAAVGPYSFGKVIKQADGSLLAFTSGQLGLDPKTNLLVEGLKA